jgi:hypothetical protein
MNPHPYFSEQIAADHRQKLTEEANTHRLLNPRVAPSKARRGIALRRLLTRRAPEPVQSLVAIPSTTTTNPSSPETAPDIAVRLPAHSG